MSRRWSRRSMAGTTSAHAPVRVFVIDTGTELIWGQKQSDSYRLLHVLLMQGFCVVGFRTARDDEDDLRGALRDALRVRPDLIVVRGGTGATDDDITIGAVARFVRRRRRRTRRLERAILERELEHRSGLSGWNRAAMEEAVRIQSRVPVGAAVIPPVGTAPGLITWRRLRKRPLVVVLPGPLTELLAMWQRAIDTPPLRDLLPRNVPRAHRVIRMTGQESDLRVAIREIGRTRVRLNQLIISTCWEGGKELRLDVVFSPSAAQIFEAFRGALVERFGEEVYPPDAL
jgi:nicotinamide-nucleotide amidase